MTPTLTPQAFVDKWRHIELKERAACQERFFDLCQLVNYPTAKSAGYEQKRTLTNLYNQRPTWLDNAHKKLDAAVFAAYGWPVDLSDDEILARLLALNLERAAHEHGS